ncbi:class I SAM-dependent methyltransferase [Membranicola marinus]|uniref:Class I SAM-dependent methyltransferase n=1 Tax=Membranihabitans marinus TaxID=1227546 RepID=A0A953HVC6_9BACT|nr:class I SAM-dependent methyltransferase [Membranihabitans marinus]MBY5959135.1 class I SAM-dependent methyltransferase [Membranihabitans marinus]
MDHQNRKKHWENLYETTDTSTKSWYQPIPHTSLSWIEKAEIPGNAKIVDIGGGDSYLVDHLLDKGYKDITVVDISAAAIEKAKERLGHKAAKVNWIVSDVTDFTPREKYDLWHDRATFHFLTDPDDVRQYIRSVREYLSPHGALIVGTFSMNGPEKCSGLPIQQYAASSLQETFAPWFEAESCEYIDHTTPSGAIQNFVFGRFVKNKKYGAQEEVVDLF